ncbi:MAG: hypothetical protein LBE89_06715 [Helicobacteraceae bacterium]|jgi:hypothetical protein|nr:hypothetical protein [Helicobacteraceae bacterium]
MASNGILASSLCAQSLLAIRARKKGAALKAIYAAQGAVALVCAAYVTKQIEAKPLKAIAIAALGAAAISVLNKLEDNYGK